VLERQFARKYGKMVRHLREKGRGRRGGSAAPSSQYSKNMNDHTGFPIEWENPEDAKLHWTRDTVHEPRPSLPLRRSFSRDIIGAGVGRTMQVYPFPGQSRSILVNGYTFE